MKKEFVKFLNDESGAAAIEFALVSIFMIFMLLGEIELISYIMVKERINRTADETSQLLGHIANFTLNQATDRLNAADLILYPQGGTVSAIYCLNGDLLKWRDANGVQAVIPPLQQFSRRGRACGNSSIDNGDISFPLINCAGAWQDERTRTAFNNSNLYSTGEYVAVKAQCAYTPIVNIRNYIRATNITATSIITLRHSIPQ